MEPAHQPCPVCPYVLELRASDFLRWPMKVVCPACATDLYFNFKKKGGLLFLPGLLIFFGWFLYALIQLPESAFLDWPFVIVVLSSLLVTQVVIAVFGRSRVPLHTKEEARTIAHCPYCQKGLDGTAFRRPWDIECSHCGRRLQATLWSHLGAAWVSLYFGLVMVRLGRQYLQVSDVEFWVAVCGVTAIYYSFVSRYGLRLKRPSERKPVHS